MTENPPPLSDHLDRGIASACALVDQPAPARRDHASIFLRAVYEVGRAITLNPALSERLDVQEFLATTGADASRGVQAIADWLAKLETRFHGTWEWDWVDACRRRSSLEFLFSLYRATPLARHFAALEPDEADDQLRYWAPREGYLREEAIPNGIPESHWWWWAPERMGPDA